MKGREVFSFNTALILTIHGTTENRGGDCSNDTSIGIRKGYIMSILFALAPVTLEPIGFVKR